MKKLCSIIVFCFAAALYVFSYTPRRIEPVDIRAEAFGGPYFTDVSSVYTLFSNPAGLAFTGRKTLWPPILCVGLGGPLSKMCGFGFDIALKKIDTNDKEAFANALLDMVGDSGINFNTRIGGPLTFGAIRNNFGWAFVNTLYTGGNIFSLFRSDIRAGGNLGFLAGYAFPLDFGKAGVLSVGVSGRATVQFETVYTHGVVELIKDDSALRNIPFYLSLGTGFDIAAQYKIAEIVSFAVVWQDVYAPVWTKTYNDLNALKKKKGSKFGNSLVESKLGVGVKADIPVKKIAGDFFPEWGIYADYNDVWPLISKKALYRNPILELSFGMEMLLFKKILALRLGVSDMYPAAGLGLNLGKFKMDFSMFGKELGFEPGYNPQLNAGFSMSIQY